MTDNFTSASSDLLAFVATGGRATDVEAWKFLSSPFLWLLAGIWLFGFIMHWLAGRAIARDLAKKSLSERWADNDMPLQKILGITPPPDRRDPTDYTKGMN